MVQLISEHRTPRAWLLISSGDDRQHGGNNGYADEISTVYKYDNEVQNCRRIAKGDLVLLSDKKQLIGVARIELIRSYAGIKNLSRCPSCLETHFNPRKIKKPIFHCYNCGFDFDRPKEDAISCTKFDAYFGDTFVATKGAVGMDILRNACRKKGQMSMKIIDLQQIKETLIKNAPAVAKLLNDNNDYKYIESDEASEYIPIMKDRRETVFRQIKERRGQRKFRDLLRQCYGDQCMITGIKLLDVLEAAHISPYRGDEDNHTDNGLLLRADLHTLFDLNLLGINPESLEVRFHPKAMETNYQKLDGRKLRCSKYKPSQLALESRWKQFLNRLNEDD
ncbi:HNH endonuclease [Nostoc sp. TCL26-01]|uniref:HNH endonuclease n=1 Tax=Nostoc sp. TCL26-01 TaxID=2576904 RepID=UPI0015B88F5F|nr:HNH endonuclease signature motif containing protein [Nostoc sp. TCL26-01]QLE58087.1 HNH endonuclease [Nostoc sp. TCL26-01]